MAQIYNFLCESINEEPVELSRFEGKVLLIVNTASVCGLTPQYTGLEQLYLEYKDKGVEVLGFPSNQFNEEPFDNERINEFCLMNYNITFPMFAKIKVNGEEAHPLYKYLKKEKPGVLGFQRLHYNFTKFLVDRNGNVIKRFSPLTYPSTIRKSIEAVT